MRRPGRFIAALLVVAGGCADRPRLDLRMVHSPTLSPATAFERLEVRVRAVETGQLAVEVTLERAEVMDGGPVADFSALEEDVAYVMELVAAAPRTCRLGRAVGRSLPFVHRAGDYQVPVHIGCSDELFTLGRLNVPRGSHAIVATPDGAAYVGGGARQLALRAGGMSFGDVTRVVERYDPREGGFDPVGTLSVPRIAPGAVLTGQAAAAWLGGSAPDGAPVCTSSTELSVGASTSPGATLAVDRCSPGVVALPAAGVVVVVGGQVDADDRAGDIEVLNADLRAAVRTGIEDRVYRNRPTVIGLADGRSALVVAGRRGPEPAEPVRVQVGSGCDPVCVEPVAHEGLPTGWSETDGARVTCPGGDSAVYLVGGSTNVLALPASVDGVFCAEDRPEGLGRLRRVATLPEPRRLARTVAVRGRGGAPRLLVVGGVEAGFEEARDAFLIPVSCDCAPPAGATIERVPVPMTGVLIQHEAAVLADGSVLVVGGVTAEQVDMNTIAFTATGEAALLVPDLE